MTSTISVGKVSFFLNRNFRLLWLGQSVSILGDYIFNVTLILWIANRIAQGQSWAPLAVSSGLIATALPALLVGPLAGVFVDRWNKRRTMLVVDFCRMLLNLLLFALSITTQLPIALLIEIYVIVLLMTTCTQFFGPASIAMLGNIVARDDLTRATGRLQATSGLATILGLSLSAPLFFGVGVQWALLINAFSFLFSFFTLLFIQPPETNEDGHAKQQHNFIQEFKEGLHFYRQSPALLTILIAISLFLTGAGVVNALNFFFVTENLRLPPEMFSYINAAFGAGAILGAIIATQGAKRLGPRAMFWGSLLFTGILLICYARNTFPALALLIFFLLGIPNSVSNAMTTPLLLDITPGPLVGRVVSVLLPTLTLMRILSTALAGYLASSVLTNFHADLFAIHFSTIDTLFIVAGLLTIAGGLYAQFNLQRHVKTKE